MTKIERPDTYPSRPMLRRSRASTSDGGAHVRRGRVIVNISAVVQDAMAPERSTRWPLLTRAPLRTRATQGCGDRAPAGPGGLDEFEHPRQRRGRAAGPAGDLVLSFTVLKVLEASSGSTRSDNSSLTSPSGGGGAGRTGSCPHRVRILVAHIITRYSPRWWKACTSQSAPTLAGSLSVLRRSCRARCTTSGQSAPTTCSTPSTPAASRAGPPWPLSSPGGCRGSFAAAPPASPTSSRPTSPWS